MNLAPSQLTAMMPEKSEKIILGGNIANLLILVNWPISLKNHSETGQPPSTSNKKTKQSFNYQKSDFIRRTLAPQTPARHTTHAHSLAA